MAIKEFKKILSQKWIIYILFVLCFVNIFLDTGNVESEIRKADKKQEEHIERIKNLNNGIVLSRVNEASLEDFGLHGRQLYKTLNNNANH